MQIVISRSDRAASNCELEKCLLQECNGEFVLLYINRPAVVVGRNQTIEAEVDEEFCVANKIDIVRRLSGGGTVYHDLGNVNYAFILNRTDANVLDADYTAPIIRALKSFNIDAMTGKRKEILINGAKISGTASHFTRERILFHGTLLYQTDLRTLQRAISGDPTKRKNGVASVSSAVTNISEYCGTALTTVQFMEALAEELARQYTHAEISYIDSVNACIV